MPREEQDIQKALGARRTWKSQFFVAARAIELSRKPVKRELHKDERQVNFAENSRRGSANCRLVAGLRDCRIRALGLGWRIEHAVCFHQQESHFAQEVSANVRVSGSLELRQGLVQIALQLGEFRLAGLDVHMEGSRRMPNDRRHRNTVEPLARTGHDEYTFVGLRFCDVSIARSHLTRLRYFCNYRTMASVLTKPSVDQVARYADMFSAIGTEPRLRILQLLLTAHPEGLVVGEIQEELEIPSSTLSHHLDKLKNEGLVEVSRESTFLRYTANTDALQELLQFLYAECCTRSKALKPHDIVRICK